MTGLRQTSSPTSKFVVRSLYRALLRAAAPFSPPSPSAAAYASLLHRCGDAHDWEKCIRNLDLRRTSSRERGNSVKTKENNIPKAWAKNLSHSYSALQNEYELAKQILREYGWDDDDCDWDDDVLGLLMGSPYHFKGSRDYIMDEDPKFVLFRHLLQELFVPGLDDDKTNDSSGEKPEGVWPWSPNKAKQTPLMRFPCQVLCSKVSLRQLIQREFRAPTVEERLAAGEESIPPPHGTSDRMIYPPSSFIDNEIRVQTAFHTLQELNRKLAWADMIGFSASSQKITMKQERNVKRLAQAAKGVSRFPLTEAGAKMEESQPPTYNGDDGSSDADSCQKSSSPIQRGTFLVAHPLMKGYFARSVIVILDHVEEKLDDESSDNLEKSEEGAGGGTYGLIINRLALRPGTAETSQGQQEVVQQNEKNRKQLEKEDLVERGSVEQSNQLEVSSEEAAPKTIPSSETFSTKVTANIMRPISFLQAIKAEDLPETVQMAFGDAPVREGGPVNLSFQMLHRKSFETADPNNSKRQKKKGSLSEIGGMRLSADDKLDDAEDAIYFGGDVIKASYGVLDEISEQEDFSFFAGACTWSRGQLAREIRQGCWLPFRGPPQMAMTGMVDHDECALLSKDDAEKVSNFPSLPNTELSAKVGTTSSAATQSSQPSLRPVGDLWLSVMCALGEGEADLAYMMLDAENVTNEFGGACDILD